MTAVIVLAPAAGAPADTTLLELTLRATDAAPANIILHPRPSRAAAGLAVITLFAMGVSDSWPVFNQVTQGIEWYQNGVKYTGALSAGAAVFPAEPDVRTGVDYGPSGTDYRGSYAPPAAAGGMSRGRVCNA
jgi:hypothetical protein